jgi:TolB-like protein
MDSTGTPFGPFVLDQERQRLTRDGRPVEIGRRCYLLLEMLLEAGGEPVSKQALMERAWPGTAVEEGNLTVQISTLRRHLGQGSEALIVTVPRVGYRLVARPGRTDAEVAWWPLIAVLPFANLGSADEDGYFVDGVAEDIITALSRFKTFAVVSRSASFALRDRGGAQTVASELGVRYALEGSVRRMGEQLRVGARLIEVFTGAQLWAERYEGTTSDIFSFQDRITESVVGVIEPTIRKAEIERARRKPAANQDAYDLFLQALPLIYAPGPGRHADAIVLLCRSAALDPGFALAPAYAAWVYEKRISLRQPPLGNADSETCIALARKALALGGDDPLVRAIGGWVLYRVGNDPSPLQALRQAADDNPNNVVILTLAGAGGLLHGAAEEALGYYRRAYELSPGATEAYQFLQGMGASELVRGNDEAAVNWCLKSLATFNEWLFTYITLAAAYTRLDQMSEATAMVRRILELSPDLTVAVIESGAAEEDAFAAAVIPGLRKAGLPES